ncbi:MAG TPA: hypothetical protein VLW85_24160 [Myxococcales bacterium]|nr:hypothetical protein [Myxococcales bacterium]
MSKFLLVLCAAAVACTPTLAGLCSTSADCQQGETCSPNGLCLRPQATAGGDAGGTPEPDGGGDSGSDAGSDAGDSGVVVTPASTIDLLTPASGASLPGHFHVTAQSDSTTLATGVDITITNSVAGASLGQLSVTTPAGTVWSGDVTLTDGSFGGGAKVAAVLHRSGLSDVVSSAVPVVIDQSAPQIDAFDAGGWWARDAGIVLTAAILDDRTGVASATLTLPDGGTYAATLIGSQAAAATFRVPAADVVAPGQAAAVPFSLAASDGVGNRSGRPDASVLEVDDEPPTIGVEPPDPAVWRGGALDIAAVVGDGQGSGVAATALQIGGASIAGLPDAGAAFTFHADLPALFPATEGRVPLQIVAVDGVGNPADAGYSILVDDVPPSFAPAVATAADYVDGTGTHWFKAGAGTVTVQADVDAGAGSPLDEASLAAAFTGGSAVAGGGGPYTFAIPRTLGAGSEGPQHVALQGQDTAGNAGGAGIDIAFDDVAPTLGASPVAPTGWIARSAGTFPLKVTASDQGSGVASVSASDGTGPAVRLGLAAGVWSATVSTAFAPASQEQAAMLPVQANNGIGNAHTVSYPILVDDVPPAVSADASNPANAAWHSAGAGNLTFTASAKIADQGSGVASARLGGVIGSPGANGAWSFPSLQLPSTGTLESSAYSFALVTLDNVGNETDTTMAFAVDNHPPVVSSVEIDTAFDGTDSSSQGWFQGPTACPACGSIQVSAVITDGYLDNTSPIAKVGSNSYAGTLVAGRWQFQIARSEGLNASAPVTVGFDAADQAGNHPVSPPALSLQFDDVPASAFKPAIAADTTWYGRVNSLSISPTFTKQPRSGMKSLTLKVAGQSDVTCNAGTGICQLPASYAPAATEAALSFTVVATSGTQLAASSAASRNFDDLPPVVTASSFSYPAAVSGPLGWGHDGAGFTLRDSIPATTFFTAYDCGAGVNTAASGAGFSPVPATRAVALADSGTRHACANGNSAIVYNVNASATPSSAPIGSYTAINNTLTLTPSIQDAASGQTHTTNAPAQSIAITRSLWKVSPGFVLSLALGPRLFGGGADLFAFDPATGAQTSWGVGGVFLDGIATGVVPQAVLFHNSFNFFAGNASAGSTVYAPACGISGTDGAQTAGLVSGSSLVVASTSPKTVAGCDCSCCSADSTACNSAICYLDGCGGCFETSVNNFTNTLSLSGSTVSCSSGGIAPTTHCAGAPGGPASLSQRISSASVYVGSNGGAWVAANSAGATLNTYGATLSSPGWPMIDGSASSIAYLPGVFGTPSRIDAVQLTTGGFGSLLYDLSGFAGSIIDMTLGSSGLLYVLSGNTIYAVITDSTGGLSNQASAWPAQCHDPCRSSAAGYSCPY